MAHTDLRCQGDVDLEKKLLEAPEIRRVVESSATRPDGGVRKELLATSVRLSAGMAPRIASALEHCVGALGVAAQVELYVYANAAFNAHCMRPEKGRLMLLFSSSLIESFDDDELRFVMGHELGHHIFEHHRIPVNAEEAKIGGPLALTLFAWSRYAEVSADRAGLACTGRLDPAARTLFKLASGLKSDVVKMSADALLSQAKEVREEIGRAASAAATPSSEWFSTHPFSPLRLWAAKAYCDSTQFGGARAMGDVELEVTELMSLMEPTYLQEKSEPAELMRRLLLAGAVTVADASDGISDEEKAVIDRFFGKGSASGFNAKALAGDLDRRMSDVRERVPKTRQIQVLRDLCLVALADGKIDDAERTVLFRIADGLEVGRDIVERGLTQAPALD
jgi:tellurite resistance protein